MRFNRTLIMTLLSLVLSSSAHCEPNTNMDTTSHFGGGAVVAGLTYYYLPDEWSPIAKWIVATAAGGLAGAFKEGVYDKTWDSTDFNQWVGGGTVGATIMVVRF